MPSQTPPPLRILIVEDDMLIAIGIECTLIDLGCQVIGPVATANQALALIAQNPPDCALVDIGLSGSSGFTVADELQRRGIPFAFSSGRVLDAAQKAAYPDAPHLLKPYPIEALEHSLLAPLRRSLNAA